MGGTKTDFEGERLLENWTQLCRKGLSFQRGPLRELSLRPKLERGVGASPVPALILSVRLTSLVEYPSSLLSLLPHRKLRRLFLLLPLSVSVRGVGALQRPCLEKHRPAMSCGGTLGSHILFCERGWAIMSKRPGRHLGCVTFASSSPEPWQTCWRPRNPNLALGCGRCPSPRPLTSYQEPYLFL